MTDAIVIKAEKRATVVKWVEIDRVLKNNSITATNIVNQLTKYLTDDQLKAILQLGIKQCYNKFDATNSMIDDVHQSVMKLKINTNLDIYNSNASSDDENYKYCRKLFNSSDIKCNIFKFLDLWSLFQCGLVNSEWCKDSNRPNAVYHFDFDHNAFRKCRNITRFRHAVSINIGWKYLNLDPKLLGHDISYFNNVEKLYKL